MTQKKILLALLAAIVLFINTESVHAKLVPGYIVDLNGDSILGFVELSKIHRITNSIIIKGYDLESLHVVVEFLKSGEKYSQFYNPEQIQEFGFRYKSEDCTFVRFVMQNKSLFKADSERRRFAQVIYNGTISLYKDVIIQSNPNAQLHNDQFLTYYSYFIRRDTNEIFNIEVKDHIVEALPLLQKLNVESDYLKKVPEKVLIDEIEGILEDYDKWLLNRNRI